MNSDQLSFLVTGTKNLVTFNKTFCMKILLYENNYLVKVTNCLDKTTIYLVIITIKLIWSLFNQTLVDFTKHFSQCIYIWEINFIYVWEIKCLPYPNWKDKDKQPLACVRASGGRYHYLLENIENSWLASLWLSRIRRVSCSNSRDSWHRATLVIERMSLRSG